MYFLTEWEDRTGKYWLVLTESQMFFRPARPKSVKKHILSYDSCVIFLTERKSVHGSIYLVSRAFLAGPYAFFRPYHLTRTPLGTLFSYGFPTKLRARSYGSHDKMGWITWLYSDKQISVLCDLVSVFKRSLVITWLLISSLCGKFLHFYVRISLLKMNLVPVG